MIHENMFSDQTSKCKLLVIPTFRFTDTEMFVKLVGKEWEEGMVEIQCHCLPCHPLQSGTDRQDTKIPAILFGFRYKS